MSEKLEQLRDLMAERHMDIYLIPTAGLRESEHVGERLKCGEFLTGFTGSAGIAVVTLDEAGLWADGRYFVQMASQLGGSGFTLWRMGREGVPTVGKYLEQTTPGHGVLGSDGRVVNSQMGRESGKVLESKAATFSYEENLVGMIWLDRPALSVEPVWILDEKYVGVSTAQRIVNLRKAMEEAKVGVRVLATLDDVVRLFSIRGNDIPYDSVVLSYVVVTEEKFYLFINLEVLGDEVKAHLKGLGVTLKPYSDIYESVKTSRRQNVLPETGKTNYAVINNLDNSSRIIDKSNPTAVAEAVENPAEIEGERKAYIKDGVAVTKFIYWLKKTVKGHSGNEPLTGIGVSDYLEELRRQQEDNLGLSLDTTSAYKEHAAMCHYPATPETDVELKPEGLYLVDSGGQYYEGATDVTKTVALGSIADEERGHFTLIVVSMLRLGHVKFLHGCRGLILDHVAREPFWTRGLNHDHDTGHDVGYLLNVYKRPHDIRRKMVPKRMDSVELEADMVTSDEPGICIEDSHGVRTENLMVCKSAERNGYGQFMESELLTPAPIDLDVLDPSIMEPKDIAYLNAYHREVYEKISPCLIAEGTEWLEEHMREIS